MVGAIGGPDSAGLPSTVRSLVTAFRFLTPAPAWANLHARLPGSLAPFNLTSVGAVRGSWDQNARGELAGSRGALGVVRMPPSARFAFSVDLLRPDALVGVVIGRRLPGRGYMLAIRMDERQAWWAGWRGPHFGRWRHIPSSRPFPLNDLAGEIQYVLRTLLPSVIMALALAFLVLLLLPAVRLLSWTASVTLRKVRFELPPRPDGLTGQRLAPYVAVLIAGGATAIMGWLSGYAYQRLPSTQDTVVDLFQARTLALGRLWAPVPNHLWFFGQYATLNLNHHWFGKYPPGWALVLSVGVLLGVPWLVNPIVSGAGVLLVYFIGRELFGWKVGLLAELLALSSPFILFLGAGFYAEPATWLFLAAYVYLVLRWRRATSTTYLPARRSVAPRLYLAGAGLAIGMAAITRPLDAIAFGLPFLLLFVARPLWVGWLAPGAAVPVGSYVAYSVILTGSWIPNGHQLADKWDRLGFGSNVGGPAHSYFSAFTPNVALANVAMELENFHIGVFGWPFFIAIALMSVPFVLGRARRADFLVLAGGLGILVAYWFYWGTAIIQSSFPRYWYELAPCAALLVARGLQELYRLPLSISWLRLDRVTPALAPAALLGTLLVFNVTMYSPTLAADVHSWNLRNAAPINAVARAGISHAIVFQVQNVNNWWPFGCVFNANSPLMNGSVIFAEDRGWWDRQLMFQYPHRRYYRLDNTKLTRIYPGNAGRKFKPQPSARGQQECGAAFTPPARKRVFGGSGLHNPPAQQ